MNTVHNLVSLKVGVGLGSNKDAKHTAVQRSYKWWMEWEPPSLSTLHANDGTKWWKQSLYTDRSYKDLRWLFNWTKCVWKVVWKVEERRKNPWLDLGSLEPAPIQFTPESLQESTSAWTLWAISTCMEQNIYKFLSTQCIGIVSYFLLGASASWTLAPSPGLLCLWNEHWWNEHWCVSSCIWLITLQVSKP